MTIPRMMVFCLGVCALSGGDGVRGQGVPTAQLVPPPGTAGGSSSGAGMGGDSGKIYHNKEVQTFTAEVAGRLLSIEAAVDMRSENSEAPLVVRLATFEGGVVGGILASAEIPAAEIPKKLLGEVRSMELSVKAKFSKEQPVLLEKGKQYGIIFSSDRVYSNYGIWGPGGEGDRYPGGHTLHSQNSPEYEKRSASEGDYYFRVMVDPEDKGQVVDQATQESKPSRNWVAIVGMLGFIAVLVGAAALYAKGGDTSGGS